MATALTDFACMAWHIYRMFSGIYLFSGHIFRHMFSSVCTTLRFLVPKTKVKCFVYNLRARFLVLRILCVIIGAPPLSRNGGTYVVCFMSFALDLPWDYCDCMHARPQTLYARKYVGKKYKNFPHLSPTYHFSRFRLPYVLNFKITWCKLSWCKLSSSYDIMRNDVVKDTFVQSVQVYFETSDVTDVQCNHDQIFRGFDPD